MFIEEMSRAIACKTRNSIPGPAHRRAQTLFAGYAIRNIGPLTNKFSNLPLIYLHFLLTHIRFKSQSKFLHIYYVASLLPLESKITHNFTVEY
jgi:hypothetical protein